MRLLPVVALSPALQWADGGHCLHACPAIDGSPAQITSAFPSASSTPQWAFPSQSRSSLPLSNVKRHSLHARGPSEPGVSSRAGEALIALHIVADEGPGYPAVGC